MKKHIKHKKHDTLLNDYENQKRKHLTYIATRKLKKNEIFELLKTKQTNKKFLDDLEF